MKKEFTHIERKGLPGGPNEMFTYVTGVFSTEGYKRNSPDVSNPFNIIPSGSITMKDVDFPVMGTDNLGNSEMMMPGNDYQFPGDQVFEVPMAKKGGGLLTKTMKCNDCGWSWKAADGGKDVSTCHKCGGSALPKAQDGGDIDNTYYTNDPNDPRIQMYQDSSNLYKQGELDFIKYKNFIKENNIPSSSLRTWNDPLAFKPNSLDYANIQPITGAGFWYHHSPDIISNTTLPSKSFSPNTYRYKKPTQPVVVVDPAFEPTTKPKPVNKDLPKHELQSLDKREGSSSKQFSMGKAQEIEVNPKLELPYYQRTGFNSGLQRIQPSNYDPDTPTLRGEPFQMDMQGNIYQSGGSLPKAQDGNGEYTVESGNTFDGIANKLGINKQTLRQVNPGINYNELQVGQTIKYPAQKPEPTSWGDYMNPMNWWVSNRDDDGDFKQAFRAAREAGEDEFMWYGTRYSTDLKKTANKSQVQVEKTSDKLEPAKETKPPEGKTEKYTVKSGDTLNGIVNKKEVSKYFLKKVNPNVDYGNLNVGQVINLPDKKKDTLGVDEIENYLTITNGQTPDFWKSTADTIAFHESGPWQPMDPEAIQKSQNKKTGNFFKGPGEGVFQIETERAGGKNSFKQFKNRYESVADKLNMYADPKIINASRPIDLSLEEQYALFYTNLMEEPNVILKDYAQGDMSLIDLWLAGHKKVEKPGDRDAFRTSVERLKEEKTIFKKSGGEVDEFQVYANYINGSYNGTEMETKAEKIYDKLNRVYYRKAKALDMSAPNYIMSNIINRSGQ
tara:strand:+ start:2769 stop:5114 length:2346 start_codon:yes stop_codon:yes gene_type:complete